MKLTLTFGALALGASALFVGHFNSDAVAARSSATGASSPDVIVGGLYQLIKHGEVDGITAYSVGTESCNIGNDFLRWEGNNNFHPTISGNMYRVLTLDNGCTRCEHIGMSWLKHGFCALQYTLCGSCSNSAGSGCPNRLGWICSDPYSASLNGQQSNLGPRSEVNATTGYFPYPPGGGSYPATIGRRLQVLTSDLAVNNAEFFVEGMYVHAEDAAACAANNNASYRQVTRSGSGSNGYNLSLTSSTRQTLPAIFAWQEVDTEARVTTVEVSDCNETFYVAQSVCENTDGTYHYEYGVYNLNMDNSIGAFRLPYSGSDITNYNHGHAPYHSGDVFVEDGWSHGVNNGKLSFFSETFATNVNANAIRYNSMHSIGFDSALAPIEGQGEFELFKSGESVLVPMLVPNAVPFEWCTGDIDQDHIVDGADLSLVLGYWGTSGSNGSDLNGDGNVDGADLSIFLGNWGCTTK